MKIEYEATFLDIDKGTMRQKLAGIGARLAKPEFMQKRVVFNLPAGHEINGGWLRVRDEQDKITMTLKVVDGDAIENQKEIELKVDDFETAVSILETIGCKRKSYQETKRELWIFEDVEVTIDTWPFLDPFVEIEGKDEKSVKDMARSLELDWDKALFCSVDVIYKIKYGVPFEVVNAAPKIVFDMENPFNSYEIHPTRQ